MAPVLALDHWAEGSVSLYRNQGRGQRHDPDGDRQDEERGQSGSRKDEEKDPGDGEHLPQKLQAGGQRDPELCPERHGVGVLDDGQDEADRSHRGAEDEARSRSRQGMRLLTAPAPAIADTGTRADTRLRSIVFTCPSGRGVRTHVSSTVVSPASAKIVAIARSESTHDVASGSRPPRGGE